jgi:hypothetical protein
LTVVRASAPYADAGEARAWMESAVGSEEEIESVAEYGVAILNRALFAQAAAVADARVRILAAAEAEVVRIGFGSGEEVASGRFGEARLVDLSASGTSRSRRRAEALRPQERVAAVLGGRERIDACEPLLLRARADLDAGRFREAALQLRVALEALLVELDGAIADPGHAEDMAILAGRRGEAGAAADAAIAGEMDADDQRNVRELVELCERVLRRRRVLRGG